MQSVYYQERSLRFSGWGAVPLKGLQIQPTDYQTAQQFLEVCQQERLDCYITTANKTYLNELPKQNPKKTSKIEVKQALTDCWAQDDKVFIQKNGQEVLLGDTLPQFLHTVLNYMYSIASLLQIRCEPKDYRIEGGNFFLVPQNNTLYLLVGSNTLTKIKEKPFTEVERIFKRLVPARLNHLFNTDPLQVLSKQFGIPAERIITLPNVMYHLDLFMRPVSEDTILLADLDESMKLVTSAIQQAKNTQQPDGLIQQLQFIKASVRLMRPHWQPKLKHAALALKNARFNVIKTPALFPFLFNPEDAFSEKNRTFGVNFINALVHQRKDKSIAYITNDSSIPLLNELFKTWLSKQFQLAPTAYFISGTPSQQLVGNYITNCLHNRDGGIHCMASERPDFQQMAL